MKSMLNIGNEITNNKVTIAAITDALTKILEVGATNHTEQETIRTAIEVIAKITQVSGVTVTNSTFTNNPESQLSGVSTGDSKLDGDSEKEDLNY